MPKKNSCLFTAIAVLLALALTRVGFGQSSDDSPFALFKENIVETSCVVSRFGAFASYGTTSIGAGEGAEISDEEAIEAYQCAQSAMQRGYAKSTNPHAQTYLDWPRFSTTPYNARAHSRRYVSNYANAIAAPHYQLYENVDVMPVGSVLAKDSFVVSKDGRVDSGALAIMEKMPAGFNPSGGDWRFTLVLPDGRLFGSTGGSDEATVKFCQDCHQDAGSEQDYMFFLPKQYRTVAQ